MPAPADGLPHRGWGTVILMDPSVTPPLPDHPTAEDRRRERERIRSQRRERRRRRMGDGMSKMRRDPKGKRKKGKKR